MTLQVCPERVRIWKEMPCDTANLLDPHRFEMCGEHVIEKCATPAASQAADRLVPGKTVRDERCPIGEGRREEERTGFIGLKELHADCWTEVGVRHHRTGG